MNKLIAIVEDENKIAQILVDYFERDDFECLVISEGTNAVQTIQDASPALVILDLMLPGKDGISICRELREDSLIPIIMTTARVDDIDRILGLELGADDYICKPYNPLEVIARAKAVLRRSGNSNDSSNNQYEYKHLEMDQNSYKVFYHKETVDLTAVEFRMLYILLSNPGRVFSREQVMKSAYTDGRIVEDRTIDTHIKNIRRKLNIIVNNEEIIHSVYGVGYRLE